MRRAGPARKAAALQVGLAWLTLAVFALALRNGVVGDNRLPLPNNPHVRGLGWPEIQWTLMPAWSTRPGWGRQWISLTWLSFALPRRPDQAGVRRNLGFARLRSGRLAEALGQFRLALLGPSNAEARASLAARVRGRVVGRP